MNEQGGVKFSRPPVRTVVLTLFFEPLNSLLVSHLSPLRESLRDDYPIVDERPPLPPQVSSRDSSATDDPFVIPYVSYSARNDSGHIAVQSDRIMRAWSFSDADRADDYPGFDKLLEGLISALEKLQSTVAQETGDTIVITGAECSYRNELPQSSSEQTLVGVTTRWALPYVDGNSASYTYAGLRLELQDPQDDGYRALIALDADEVGAPVLDISAKYEVLEPSADAKDDGLGKLTKAHDKVLSLFFDYTSEAMRANWGVSK